MDSVNTSRLVVGNNGQTSFSGLGSGIDFQAAVDSMVKARMIPVDKLSDKIKVNGDKIKAYSDLSTKLGALRGALDKLQGRISADRSTNIFLNKQSFASTSRTNSLLYNPTRTAPSTAANLIGVTVTNAAEQGSYNIEVMQTAIAQKDSSQVFASRFQSDQSDVITDDNVALNGLFGGFATGSFTINGKSVSVNDTDTLRQVRDKINAVADIGVTASITGGAGNYRLVITNNTAASTTTYSDSGSQLTTLGVLLTGAPKNQLQAPISGTNTALNNASLLGGGFTGGSFTINGKTITLQATNTLKDVRDNINAANAGVTASIVSSSASESYLVITSKDTGVPINYVDSSNVLASLGVLNNDDTVKNQLQNYQVAQFTANGLRDQSRKRSEIIYNPAVALSTLAPGLVTAGAQSFTINSGTAFTVNYDNTMSINQIASAINSAAGSAGADVTASIETVAGGNGGFRLVIKDTSGDAVNFSGDTGGFVSAMTFTDPRVITRTKNNVDDLITGMTINLFAAEGGTNIKIDVDQNLNDVKNQLVEFVRAYNEIVNFMNTQNTVDPITGAPTKDTGALFGSTVLSNVKETVNTTLASITAGVNKDFSSLGNIGIKFVKNNEVSDPKDYNTLMIDESKLDAALLNNGDNVRKLFTFDGSTNDSRFQITGFDGKMVYDTGGVGINFVHNGTTFTSADIGGDSSAVQIVNSNTIKILKGNAAGMVIFYNGAASSGSFTANYTVGVAANLFSKIDNILALNTGTVDNEVNSIKTLNKITQERVDRLNDRINSFRETQLLKFQKMEQAISRGKSILDTLKQSTQNNNKN